MNDNAEKPKDDTKREKKRGADRPEYLGAKGAVSGQGRAGGRLARDIGTRDEMKRSEERPAGKTRVRKKDEDDG